MKISAYVPCFNNEATILETLASLRGQEHPLDEIFVLDDGSTDESSRKIESVGIRVIHNSKNLGRGAVRALAMETAKNDLVLCCDATNILPPNFATIAVEWFRDPKVAAVFGCLRQQPGGNAATRWRGRHLFRMGTSNPSAIPANRKAWLATYGTLVRREALLQVGNFDASLRHSEDAELGGRLISAGWDVVMDTSLATISIVQNSIPQVLERYWRWNAGKDEAVTFQGYIRGVWFSWKSMIPTDIRAGDPTSSLISFVCPHYQFWRSALRKIIRP